MMQVYPVSKQSKASDMQKHHQKLQMVEYNTVTKSRSTSQWKTSVQKRSHVQKCSIKHAIYVISYKYYITNKYLSNENILILQQCHHLQFRNIKHGSFQINKITKSY